MIAKYYSVWMAGFGPEKLTQVLYFLIYFKSSLKFTFNKVHSLLCAQIYDLTNEYMVIWAPPESIFPHALLQSQDTTFWRWTNIPVEVSQLKSLLFLLGGCHLQKWNVHLAASLFSSFLSRVILVLPHCILGLKDFSETPLFFLLCKFTFDLNDN